MSIHPDRTPLTIRNGVIDVGVDRTHFAADHSAGLLRTYLLLVRRSRDQRCTTSVTLRRDDIEILADYLDTTAETVLERLADLMGSTRTQRAAMLTVFAGGAMLIAPTGSVAADSPRPLVHEIVSGLSATTVAETNDFTTPRRPGWLGGWGGCVVGVGSVMFVARHAGDHEQRQRRSDGVDQPGSGATEHPQQSVLQSHADGPAGSRQPSPQ